MNEWLLRLRAVSSMVFTSTFVLLMVSGGLGTNARYWLGRWLNEMSWARGFPLGTFVINVSGSFILGIVFFIVLERLPPAYQNWYLILGTGFCGGYTTFSTFELESFRLVRLGSWWLAAMNIVGSVVAGFLGVWLAIALASAFFPNDRISAMKIEADAKLVTVYVNSTDQWHAQPLYAAIVSLCKEHGIAGATVAVATEGYGSHGHIHTTRLLELSTNLPVRIEIVDIAERIEALLPALDPLIGEGLMTIADVRIRRYLPDPKE